MSDIFETIKLGNQGIIKKFIKNKGDINTVNEHGSLIKT